MSEEQRRQGSGLSLEERKVKFSSAPRLETALRGPRKKIAIYFSTETPDSASRGPEGEPRPASAPASGQLPAGPRQQDTGSFPG